MSDRSASSSPSKSPESPPKVVASVSDLALELDQRVNVVSDASRSELSTSQSSDDPPRDSDDSAAENRRVLLQGLLHEPSIKQVRRKPKKPASPSQAKAPESSRLHETESLEDYLQRERAARQAATAQLRGHRGVRYDRVLPPDTRNQPSTSTAAPPQSMEWTSDTRDLSLSPQQENRQSTSSASPPLSDENSQRTENSQSSDSSSGENNQLVENPSNENSQPVENPSEEIPQPVEDLSARPNEEPMEVSVPIAAVDRLLPDFIKGPRSRENEASDSDDATKAPPAKRRRI